MRVIAGPEKKTRVMSEKERLITAYHEMGHAIVGHFLEHADPVHKISVISRGQALGYTISMPKEDRFLTTRAELDDTMAMTLGGRAAEEIVFGEITTGASNDLEKVTATAKQMVMRFGMSEKLGPRVFGHDHGQPFLGREFSTEPDYSDEIAREIDDEVRRIIEGAHQRAREHPHRTPAATSTTISEILVKRETIEKEEFVALLAGKSEEEVFGPDEADAARAAGRRAPPLTRARARSAAHAAAPRPRRRRCTARRRAPRAASPPQPLGASAGARTAADAALRPARAHRRLQRSRRGRLPPDGDRQRDARLVLRRGPLPRPRAARRARPRARRARAPTILDVGGESTRPGAEPVRGRARSSRACVPVLEGLARPGARAQISIDTSKAAVARAALDAGRDVRQRRHARCAPTPRWPALVAERGVECCLMHMLGRAAHDAARPRATSDVVAEVKAFLEERLRFAVARGHRRASASCSTPASASARPSRTTSSCCARLDELRRARAPDR